MQGMIGKAEKNTSRLPTHRHRRTSAHKLLPVKINQPPGHSGFFFFVSGSITTVRKRLPAAAGREVDTGHNGEPGMEIQRFASMAM